MKSRRTIRPFGVSTLINTLTNSSGQISWSGRVLVNNFFSSNPDNHSEQTNLTDSSHVIIQIIPDPVTVPPVAIGIPVQPAYYDNQAYRRVNKNV